MIKRTLPDRAGWRIKAFLIIAEIVTASAIALLGFIILTIENPHARMGIQRQIPSLYRPDSRTGYSLRENLAADVPITPDTSYSVYTNQEGIRVASAAAPTPRGGIVVVGDSQSFGMGIEYQQTFAAGLERMLSVPVANLGVPGYGTVAALRRLEGAGDLAPKLVILGHYHDHPRRNVNRCSPAFWVFDCITAPYVSLRKDGSLAEHEPRSNDAAIRQVADYFNYVTGQSPPYTWLRDYWWSGLRRAQQVFASLHLVDTYPYTAPIDPRVAEPVTRQLLIRMRELSARQGARFLILYIPDCFGDHVGPAPDYLVGLTRELGIPLVDPTEAIEDVKKNHPELLAVPGDDHLQPEPHRRIAEALASAILEEKLLER